MLSFLFPRLTAESAQGADLFDWVVAQARAAHWYLDGGAGDTIDGRFAMLATIAALATVRLERAGDQGRCVSVALTERFIEAMKSEHRELGLGDPKLGRTVRMLVGSLARRVGLWRSAASGGDWIEAARRSVYGETEPPTEALHHTAAALRQLWSRLESAADAAVFEGDVE